MRSDVLHGVQNVTFSVIQEARRRQDPAVLIGLHPIYGRPFSIPLGELSTLSSDDVRGFKELFGVADGYRPIKSPAAIRHRHLNRPIRRTFEHAKRLARCAARRFGAPGAPVRMHSDLEQLEMAAGDVILLPGLNLWYPEYNRSLGELCRARGAHLGLVVHDLGPITAPSFWPRSYCAAFEAWVDTLFPYVNLFVAVSEFTRNQLRTLPFASKAEATCVLNPLAHEFTFGGGGSERQDVLQLSASEFVLYVGRIEPRKNIIGLIRVWSRLFAEFGDSVPVLALAGRVNYETDDFKTAMAEIGPAAKRIRVLENPAGNELAALYRTCRFAVYPSFFEGWGLPVGEAASFGKITAASHAASIPEVVGDLAVYFDPYSLDDMATKIRQLIADPAHLKALEERLQREFRPRSWGECAGQLLDTLQARALSSPPFLSG